MRHVLLLRHRHELFYRDTHGLCALHGSRHGSVHNKVMHQSFHEGPPLARFSAELTLYHICELFLFSLLRLFRLSGLDLRFRTLFHERNLRVMRLENSAGGV